MASNRELQQTLTDREQAFSETTNKVFAQSTLGLVDVQVAKSRAPNAIDNVGRDASLTWKGYWGPWMQVKEEMQEQMLHHLRLQGSAYGEVVVLGWEG